MKYIKCDMCGEHADWDDPPILIEGVVLQFRVGSGGPDFEYTKEICETCKGKLLKAFPKLKQK